MIKNLNSLSPKLFCNWKVCGFTRTTQTCVLRNRKNTYASPLMFTPYRFSSSTRRNFSEVELMELNQKASQAFREGDYGEAIELWEMVSRSENYSKDSPAVISCLNNLASVYGKVGENMRKVEILENVRQVTGRMYGVEHLQYAMSLYHLACAKEEIGMYEDMCRYLEESLAVHEKRFNPKNIKVARVLLLLANAHEKLGQPEAQLNKAERAYEITKHHYGAEHMQTTSALVILSRAYGANNQPEQYLKLAQKALELQESRLGCGNPKLALGMLELARAHGANGDFMKQKELLERALGVQERAIGEQPIYLVDTYLSLGDAYGQLGEVASMSHWYNEALKIARQQDGVIPVEVGRAATKAALGSLEQGNLAKARRLAAEATELLSTVSHSHPLAKELAEIKERLAANEK